MPSLPKEKIIKSKTRVRDQGEVFTQDREVKNILKLTQATSNIFWRFLEPACGDGNFLVEIVRQRLEHIKHNPNYRPKDKREFVIIHMISSIYGVDIAEDNIAECKKRIRDEIFDYIPKKSSAAFLLTLQNILDSNIQLGDMLNGKEKVYFVEYAFHGSEYLNRCKVKRRVYSLLDMERGDNKPVEELPAVSPADMKAIDLTEYHTVLDENINSEPDQIALFNTEQNNV